MVGITIKQRGGKYIDKGSFGCVISPAVPCSGKDKTKKMAKYVSKITMLNVSNEIKISSILKKVDPTHKFYITFYKYCYVNNVPDDRKDLVGVHFRDEDFANYRIDSGQEKKDKNACPIDLTLRPINMIIEYGGYSLSSIMKVKRTLKGARAIMHQMFIDNLRKYFKHLILGLIKMHNNRIVNRDIKQKNIMVSWNKKTNVVLLRYIDFGLSELLTSEYCQDINNINHNGTQFYVSPEMHIAHIVRRYHGWRSWRKEIPEYYIKRKILHEIHSTVKKALMRIDMKQILETLDKETILLYEYINSLFEKHKILPKYFGSDKNKFNGYIQKCDVYALGYSIYETLHHYSGIDVTKNKLLYDLLSNMLTVNPSDRYNAVQCLNHPYFTSDETIV